MGGTPRELLALRLEEGTTGQGFQEAPESWEWLWHGHGRELSRKEGILPTLQEQGPGSPGASGEVCRQPGEPASGFCPWAHTLWAALSAGIC